MIVVHRLLGPGAIQYVPAALLEGGKHTEDMDHIASTAYIDTSAELDMQVAALHHLARVGKIAADTAERQINTYLLVPRAVVTTGVPIAWLRMSIADAPHFSSMPDLGNVIHRVLIREPSVNVVAHIVELCIPRFRHPPRPLQFTDSQHVLLMLVMGLLLGLYAGPVKKPCFQIRACIFARLRAVMTSSPEEQTRFCSSIGDLILFACMEYMARVLPTYMPVQYRAITEGDSAAAAFYRRIPPLADEIRQWIDKDICPSWGEIRLECESRMERVVRLKRGGLTTQTSAPVVGPSPQLSHDVANTLPRSVLMACWNTPTMGARPTAGEYMLLGMDLDVPGHLVQWIQQEVQIFPLPRNLCKMQMDAIRRRGMSQCRASYMQTHWPICAKCIFNGKSNQSSPPKRLQMRLDTLTRTLVCATCLSPEVIHVNLLGRAMVYRRTTFYVCPACVSIQPYKNPIQQPWGGSSTATCSHTDAREGLNVGGKIKRTCYVCGENAHTNPLRRVDQLTGIMQEFHYCQRHAPRPEAAKRCVNARQLAILEQKGHRIKR